MNYVFFISIVSAIFFVEGIPLIKEKQFRELGYYIVILLSALVFGILIFSGITLPSPANLIELVIKPIINFLKEL